MAKNLTEMDEFQREVLGSQIPVLVDFWATWCPPCRMLAPTIDELSNEADGKYSVFKIDTDSDLGQALQAEYRISAIPTCIFFKNGSEASRVVGAHPKSTLLEKLTS
jgi:thioredoxin 1